MAVTQVTKDSIVIRQYAVGETPAVAFVNGFYNDWNEATLEQMASGGKVFTFAKEIMLVDISDVTPSIN